MNFKKSLADRTFIVASIIFIFMFVSALILAISITVSDTLQMPSVPVLLVLYFALGVLAITLYKAIAKKLTVEQSSELNIIFPKLLLIGIILTSLIVITYLALSSTLL